MNSQLFVAIALGLTLVGCGTTSGKQATATQSSASTKPAEKIAKNMQSIAVTTNPEGANCSIAAKDEVLGTAASTPSNVVIKRMTFSLGAKVTCSKQGFTTRTVHLGNSPAENQIGGNIGSIFTAVKMLEGSLASWDDSIHVTLVPAYFTSTAQRDDYLDGKTALLNSEFTAASKKYLTCDSKKCTKALAELQTEYDTDLAKLKADVTAIPVT